MKTPLSEHMVITNNAINHSTFQIFSLEKHEFYKNLEIFIKTYD